MTTTDPSCAPIPTGASPAASKSHAANARRGRWLLGLFGVLLCGGAPAVARSDSAASPTITNPVAPIGNDPWVIQKDGVYYYCYSWRRTIHVNSSPKLEQAVQFPGKKVWVPPATGPYSKEVWAPELHYLNGKWYIYFAADNGENANHRMYVLEAKTQDPTGDYEFKGQLTPQPDKWAIDGTILQHQGKLYMVWSGWPGDVNGEQDLFIARMSDPTTITGPRVLISTPEYKWERRDHPLINEGPTALYRGDKVHLVYSASGSWANNYCLGLLTLVGDDPMQPSAWKKRSTPVFVGTKSVISPGHASFTKSPDGTEDWIVYHAARHAGSGWDRNTRMQRFGWDGEGYPVFGRPIAEGVPLPAPATGGDAPAHP